MTDEILMAICRPGAVQGGNKVLDIDSYERVLSLD